MEMWSQDQLVNQFDFITIEDNDPGTRKNLAQRNTIHRAVINSSIQYTLMESVAAYSYTHTRVNTFIRCLSLQ